MEEILKKLKNNEVVTITNNYTEYTVELIGVKYHIKTNHPAKGKRWLIFNECKLVELLTRIGE